MSLLPFGAAPAPVKQLIAGTNITLSPSNGKGSVTVNAAAGGGITTLTSTGASLTITNQSGPTANAELAAPLLASLYVHLTTRFG